MDIIQSLDDLAAPFGPSVVTLGNFDGVHLGHRELFRRVVRKARQLNCSSVIYTFEPHPLKFLAPERAPLLLNTREEKQRLIAASNVDLLVEAPFNRELASMLPERFIDEVLLGKLQAQALVIGYDYAFGKGRSGNASFLKAYGESRGIVVEVLQPVGADGEPYSSTRIRQLVSAGAVADVVHLLGRHYTLEGRVVYGAQRGRKLGFPTANLVTDKELLPAPGVYAVKARYGEQVFNAVVNLGRRPTFDDGQSSIEVHLLDFNGRLYEDVLRIYFVARLRDERRFSGPDELSKAISADVLQARKILECVEIIQYMEYLSE